ncbi:MAG: signal peptidase I [Actinomycetota bacterium]|nr:signal peptidase I [Actinomycetota bacterium]
MSDDVPAPAPWPERVSPPPAEAREIPAVDPVPVREETVRSRHAKPKEHHRSFLRELPFLVGIAFVLALLIKHFLVQAFYIPSGSMEQTLLIGDRVLVDKVPYHFREPHRGEIVVFNGLDNFDDGAVTFAKPTNPVSKALRSISGTIGLGAPSEKDYIKRVIGVPGDRVMCCDTGGRVVVTDKSGTSTSLVEPYVFGPDTTDTRYFCDAGAGKQLCPPGAQGILVPEGRLWVMGDHRGNSADSRAHLGDAHRGTVPEDKVVGRAFAIVYPFGRAEILHVPEGFHRVALPAVPLVGGFVGALPLVALRRRYRLR